MCKINSKEDLLKVYDNVKDVISLRTVEKDVSEKYHISVCLGTACYVKGSGAIIDRIQQILGIQAEECTADGKFSLTACRCIGACGLAPVLTINDDVYGRIAPEEIDGILEKYK